MLRRARHPAMWEAKFLFLLRKKVIDFTTPITKAFVLPDNITLLPPRSPELNPVENVWQFLRDNHLSNRVFKGYDDIVAHCCDAWNGLMDQPWRIRSLGRRTWAEGF
jgi:putative transposase